MGNKKKVIGVIGALTALLGVILGSGVVIDFSTDSSINTNIEIGQIGDNVINTVINQMGLDITTEELRTLCGNGGSLEEPFKTACSVIGRNIGG